MNRSFYYQYCFPICDKFIITHITVSQLDFLCSSNFIIVPCHAASVKVIDVQVTDVMVVFFCCYPDCVRCPCSHYYFSRLGSLDNLDSNNERMGSNCVSLQRLVNLDQLKVSFYLPPIFEKRREVLSWGSSPSPQMFRLISRLLLKLAFLN